MKFIKDYLDEYTYCLRNIDKKSIDDIIKIIDKNKSKGRVFFLGVGGSAANSSHAVNDFRKLCNIEAYSVSENISEITARINDDGWKTSYSNWLKVSKLTKKDILFILSVGGGSVRKKISENIIEAIKYAKSKQSKIVGIVGKDGGFTSKYSNAVVKIPINNKNIITPITESFQSIIWHCIVSDPRLKINDTKW